MTTASPYPTRALIIADPWISSILDGLKTWEMRTQVTRIRGRIGLIRKGSGLIVGTAELVDCLPPLNAESYASQVACHGIPTLQQTDALTGGWTVPWVLRGARALACPVPYEHPAGAVIWVTLDAATSLAVGAQDRAIIVSPSPVATAPPRLPTAVAAPMWRAAGGPVARSDTNAVVVRLTQGNIKNHHIYLRQLRHLLPQDAIGGSNTVQAAPKRLTVVFNPGPTVETDVCGEKFIFRDRGATRAFLTASGAQAGSEVRIVRTGAYAFRVELVPA